MKTAEKITVSLNAILVQDPKLKSFTAYFKQFPNVIVEGENEKDALKNLVSALHDVFKYQTKSEAKTDECGGTFIEKSVDLVFA